MDFELMLDSIPKIFGGARLTVLLVTLSLSMGFVLAIIVALLRRSGIPVLFVPIINGEGYLSGEYHHHYGNDRHCQYNNG